MSGTIPLLLLLASILPIPQIASLETGDCHYLLKIIVEIIAIQEHLSPRLVWNLEASKIINFHLHFHNHHHHHHYHHHD